MYEGIEDIIRLLNEGRLKEALTQLQAISSQDTSWEMRDRIKETLTTYGYMLQYAAKGVEDPARAAYFRKLRRKAYELTDIVNFSLLARKTNHLFYENVRTYKLHPNRTYAQLQLMLEAYTEDISTAPLLYNDKKRLKTEIDKIHQIHEEALIMLFNKTWTTPVWSDTEANEANELLHSVLVSPNDLAVCVSAATLSLLRIFDYNKVLFLLNAYRHESLQVNQRALVGIAIMLQKHTYRISLYPEIVSQISLLKEEESFSQNLYTIQMQLLITRETTKIDKKMREEIIPEMMKNVNKMDSSKFRFDDVEDPEDLNPEWDKWLDKSGMGNKLREMGEWQQAGADVYMSSFAHLKNYPFFNDMPHWFYPFDLQHPILEPLQKDFEKSKYSPLQLIAHSDYFCNSDKYSFCLTILSIPPSMRETSILQMEEQVRMQEEEKAQFDAIVQKKKEAIGVSRQYIQDLYRFFKLWRRHDEEEDIFSWKFDLWENPILGDILLQGNRTRELADYLLKKDYLDEAFTLYNKLITTNTTQAEIYQKAGYILQKQKKYTQAISLYEQADILASDNLWTNKHLAQCHRLSGNQAEALTYYKKVEAVQPDNLNIALQIGQCLTRLQKFDEALSYFYKVEYLEKNPDNARRAIAWCSFLTDKMEEALKYYNLLTIKKTAKAEDWMNMGHVYRSCGKLPEALESYQKAHEFFHTHTEFIQSFLTDQNVLKSKGISEEDMQILLDLLI